MNLLRERLTFANVMSVVAVFIALGGTAVALKANSVGSRQVRDGSIKGRDVANGKLKGQDLAEATIGSREIQEAAFDLTPFLRMESANTFCDPTSAEFARCGLVDLAIQEPSQALLVGSGGQYGSAGARGSCKFRINGATELLASAPPGFGDSQERSLAETNGISLTAVSDVLQPGPAGQTFELICNELAADVSFDTTLSVVTLGGSGFDRPLKGAAARGGD